MNIVLPIMIVALILGLSSDKMTTGRWAFMVTVIVGTLARYWMKH